MLERAWEKLDKFYLILGLVLTLMAVMVIVAFRGIFTAYLDASDIKQRDIQVDVRVERESLDEAFAWTQNKISVPLQIRD